MLKEIFEKIEKKKLEKDQKKDIEKAKKDGDIVKFEKGTTLYGLNHKGYEEININDNDTITFNRYKYDNGIFIKDTSEDMFDVEYVFKDGGWIKRSEKPNELKYTLNSDGSMTLPEYNRQVSLLNQKDISNKATYIKGLEKPVMMPSGAKVSYLGIKVLQQEYVLDRVADEITGISVLSDFVLQKCESKEFMTLDKKECTASTVSGLSKDGKWEIKTLKNDTKVLVEYSQEESNIYAIKDSQLYTGWLENKGFEKDPKPNYNFVAMEAIKAETINQLEKKKNDMQEIVNEYTIN